MIKYSSQTTTKPTIDRPRPSGGSGKCVLPNQPEHGHYKVNGVEMTPGTEVIPFTVMTYRCDKSFASSTSTTSSFCLEDGTWTDDIKCLRKCRPLKSFTLDFQCVYRGGLVDCDKPLSDGTLLTMKCKAMHKPMQYNNLKVLTCIQGNWDSPLPRCEPECGEEKLVGVSLTPNGTKEMRNNSPWHVGIYKSVNNVTTLICGGTLVSNKIVISAAHCFENNGRIESENLFNVAAGKLFNGWDHEEQDTFTYIQKTAVKKIFIPPKYTGHESNLQEDIAVLVLENTIDFSNSIHAACFDLTSSAIHDIQVKSGNIGKVVGWRLNTEGDTSSASNELKKYELTVVDYKVCRSGVPREFVKYLLPGKYCAGYSSKGATLCSGGSGGGMVFKISDKGVDRWYLQGIVSAAPLDDQRVTCRENSYTVFTDVYKHADFIVPLLETYS